MNLKILNKIIESDFCLNLNKTIKQCPYYFCTNTLIVYADILLNAKYITEKFHQSLLDEINENVLPKINIEQFTMALRSPLKTNFLKLISSDNVQPESVYCAFLLLMQHMIRLEFLDVRFLIKAVSDMATILLEKEK